VRITIYSNIRINSQQPEWLFSRTILAPLNETVNAINDSIIKTFPGEPIRYTSIDTALTEEEATHFPTEFLHSLDIPGLPPHILILKIGSPVICVNLPFLLSIKILIYTCAWLELTAQLFTQLIDNFLCTTIWLVEHEIYIGSIHNSNAVRPDSTEHFMKI
jgi:hypothetical protein